MITDEISIPTTEIEADGFITRAETLERINQSKAKPAEKCIYPCCEECEKYHGHYCTVPMVVSKQKWLMTEEIIAELRHRVAWLEKLVTDEILGSKEPPYKYKGTLLTTDEEIEEFARKMRKLSVQTNKPAEETNMTWADYFNEESK